MKNNNYPDTGLSFIISIIAFMIKVSFKIIAFPFLVLWHFINPLNIQRVNIEKQKKW